MKTINDKVLQKIKRPKPTSHKGNNGRVLVIAGSEKFHGAMLLTVQAASRIVDMVYVYSTPENLDLVKKLKSEISTFVGVLQDELWDTVELVDAIIIGPGLEESEEKLKLTEKLLKDYKHKKVLLDATALWHVDPKLLHKNCLLTPHSREFKNVFKCEATPENVKKMAGKYNCVIVLTGPVDYISDGKELYENKTGNVGMTKGGTGDVLAGLVGGLMATNDLLISAQAGVYLNGLVGDKLYEKKGTFYNAEDLISKLGGIWNNYLIF